MILRIPHFAALACMVLAALAALVALTDRNESALAGDTGTSVAWTDANCDGVINADDVIAIADYAIQLNRNPVITCPFVLGNMVTVNPEDDNIPTFTSRWGDFNCDGVVDIVDALPVLWEDADLAISQPANCPPTGTAVLATLKNPTSTGSATPTDGPTPSPGPPWVCPGGLPLAIPDNDPNGATRTIHYDVPVSVNQVTVCLNIDHPFLGDLKATLSHNGVTVVMFDRLTSGSGDCAGPGDENIDLHIDDDASGDKLQDFCPTTPGSYEGLQLFTAGAGTFQGQDITGDWTLTISDNSSAQATGIVTGFQLFFNQ